MKLARAAGCLAALLPLAACASRPVTVIVTQNHVAQVTLASIVP